MESENPVASVLPMPEPLLEQSAGQLDKVAGDIIGAAGRCDSLLVSDGWLDELADSLSEKAWIELDLLGHLPVGLIAALRNEVEILDRTEAMGRAGIGRGADLTRDRSVRRDKIAWLDGYTAAQSELFRFFDALRVGLNQRLFLGLKRYEAHYATYQPGDFYKRHLDSFRGRASRVVSLVLYLNEEAEGPEDHHQVCQVLHTSLAKCSRTRAPCLSLQRVAGQVRRATPLRRKHRS